MQIFELETERLRLRQWKTADFAPFAKLNADTHTMRYFPKPLTQIESDALATKIMVLIAENAWGMWAVELKDTQQFIGFTGLHRPSADFDFQPCVEIGWRFLQKFWGKGYATEAAHACLDFAFSQLDLDEVVAFTATQNLPSMKVMQRLGMTWHKNFYHPDLEAVHPLAEHVLYKISKESFLQKT